MTTGTQSRSIALRFLQTVVVVDDTAYNSELRPLPSPASLGGEELEAASDGLGAGGEALDLDELDPQRLETEAIVEGFADLGMACAVLAPSRNEELGDETRLLRLAERSDVLILDWVLRPQAMLGAEGAPPVDRTSLGLLLKVLRGDLDAGGHRIRLICIYTGEADTWKVLDALVRGLEAEFKSAPNALSGRIDFGAARIVILSKERIVPTPGALTVPSRELPSRVVDEFTDLVATGLLPEVALESLSAIRDRAHRVLSRLSGDLDYALLSHRSTTSRTETEQFVLSLVGSELSSIVEAADAAAPLRDDERIEALVKEALNGRSIAYYWKNLTTTKTSEMRAEDAVKVLTLDPEGAMDKKASRSSLLIPGDAKAVRARAREIDLQFAGLSALARECTFDANGAPAPVLQLGAVLANRLVPRSTESEAEEDEPAAYGPSTGESAKRDQSAYRYWLCLQPLCDCVRLKNPTRFPMLPLREPDIANPQFELAVRDGDRYVPLQVAGSKISDIDVKVFVPDVNREVVVGQWAGDGWEFKSGEEGGFTWLGSLRLDKAHRLLHRVITAGGRIGIDEYDFLRSSYDSLR